MGRARGTWSLFLGGCPGDPGGLHGLRAPHLAAGDSRTCLFSLLPLSREAKRERAFLVATPAKEGLALSLHDVRREKVRADRARAGAATGGGQIDCRHQLATSLGSGGAR